MPNPEDKPLFPGEYIVDVGDVVFIETPAGLPEFYVRTPGGDMYTTVTGIYGVPTALGIYFHQEPLSHITKVVFSAVDIPMAVMPGEYEIFVKYEVGYLIPRWFFAVFPAPEDEG